MQAYRYIKIYVRELYATQTTSEEYMLALLSCQMDLCQSIVLYRPHPLELETRHLDNQDNLGGLKVWALTQAHFVCFPFFFLSLYLINGYGLSVGVAERNSEPKTALKLLIGLT